MADCAAEFSASSTPSLLKRDETEITAKPLNGRGTGATNATDINRGKNLRLTCFGTHHHSQLAPRATCVFFHMLHIDDPNTPPTGRIPGSGGGGHYGLVLTASNDWLRVRTCEEEARIRFRFRLAFVCDG